MGDEKTSSASNVGDCRLSQLFPNQVASRQVADVGCLLRVYGT